MTRGRLSPFIVLLGFVLSFFPALHAADYSKYLTPEDIQKETGLTGIQAVPKDPMKGFGGDLNFANAKGGHVLMVQIVDESQYVGFKSMGSGTVNGLGEKAVKGATIPGFPTNFVCFVKGDHCVALTTFVDRASPTECVLKEAQLMALAKIIASRM